MKNYFLFLLFIFGLQICSEAIPIPDSYPSGLPSARIKALGGCGTALAGDATSSFWNPAALGFMASGTLHASFAEDKNSSLSEFILKEPSIMGKHISIVSFATFQGGFSYLPVYSVSYRDSSFPSDTLNLERDFEMKLDEYMITLTTFTGSEERYATPLILGFNLKYMNGRFVETRLYRDHSGAITDGDAEISYGNGYGLDAGALLTASSFTFGFLARDIFTHIYWSDYDKQVIPIYMSAGASFNPISTLLILFDVNRILQKDVPFIYRGGIEYTFTRKIDSTDFFSQIISGTPSVRIGTSFKEITAPGFMNITSGLGYNMNSYRIDIGFEGYFENYIYGGISYQLSATLPFAI